MVNASGHATATRTITVEVLGKGSVKSSDVNGISCGGGNTKCVVTFADPQQVTLTAKPNGDFTDGIWEFPAGCAGDPTTDPCDLGTSGNVSARASFNPKVGHDAEHADGHLRR